jgi:hypothetical protein
MAAVGKSEIRNPKSEIASLGIHLFWLFFSPSLSGAERALPLKFFVQAVGKVVASATETGFSRNLHPRQHLSAHFLEEVAELSGLFLPQ